MKQLTFATISVLVVAALVAGCQTVPGRAGELDHVRLMSRQFKPRKGIEAAIQERCRKAPDTRAYVIMKFARVPWLRMESRVSWCPSMTTWRWPRDC